MKKQELLQKLTLLNEAGFTSTSISISEVISLVNSIEDEPTTTFSILTDEQITDLSNNIVDEIDNEGGSLIDDYDLSISGREVEIDSVCWDSRRMRRLVEEIVKEFCKELKLQEELAEEEA